MRALSQEVDVHANFRTWTEMLQAHGDDRLAAMTECLRDGEGKVASLDIDSRRCFLEVLYLANRAVAHPEDGELDHQVGYREMTSAINTLLKWLADGHISGLPENRADLLQAIAAPDSVSTK